MGKSTELSTTIPEPTDQELMLQSMMSSLVESQLIMQGFDVRHISDTVVQLIEDPQAASRREQLAQSEFTVQQELQNATLDLLRADYSISQRTAEQINYIVESSGLEGLANSVYNQYGELTNQINQAYDLAIAQRMYGPEYMNEYAQYQQQQQSYTQEIANLEAQRQQLMSDNFLTSDGSFDNSRLVAALQSGVERGATTAANAAQIIDGTSPNLNAYYDNYKEAYANGQLSEYGEARFILAAQHLGKDIPGFDQDALSTQLQTINTKLQTAGESLQNLQPPEYTADAYQGMSGIMSATDQGFKDLLASTNLLYTNAQGTVSSLFDQGRSIIDNVIQSSSDLQSQLAGDEISRIDSFFDVVSNEITALFSTSKEEVTQAVNNLTEAGYTKIATNAAIQREQLDNYTNLALQQLDAFRSQQNFEFDQYRQDLASKAETLGRSTSDRDFQEATADYRTQQDIQALSQMGQIQQNNQSGLTQLGIAETGALNELALSGQGQIANALAGLSAQQAGIQGNLANAQAGYTNNTALQNMLTQGNLAQLQAQLMSGLTQGEAGLQSNIDLARASTLSGLDSSRLGLLADLSYNNLNTLSSLEQNRINQLAGLGTQGITSSNALNEQAAILRAQLLGSAAQPSLALQSGGNYLQLSNTLAAQDLANLSQTGSLIQGQQQLGLQERMAQPTQTRTSSFTDTLMGVLGLAAGGAGAYFGAKK